MARSSAKVAFSDESLKFLTLAGQQTEANWLDEHDAKYQRLIVEPMVALADTVKADLTGDATGYRFPQRTIGRIKKTANRIGLDGVRYKDWVSYIVTRPSENRFEKNPLLFFGLLPNDPQWGGAVVAGGLYMTSSLQMRRMRQAIADDSAPFKKLFADREFKKSFKGGFEPMAKAQRCPIGFDPNHPDIEWIKLKTFFVCKTLTTTELSSGSLAKNVTRDFRQLLRINELIDQATGGNG